MRDLRFTQLAEVLVRYCLETRPGDRVLIQASLASAPLLAEVYRQVLRSNAHPVPRVHWNQLTEIALRESTNEQLRYVSEGESHDVENVDAWLSISAEENTRSLVGIPPDRLAMRQESRAPLVARSIQRMTCGELRWTHTVFPTDAYAQDAGMSLADYEDFLFGAALLKESDPIAAWREQHCKQQKIVEFLEKHDEVRIIAPEVDLSFRVGNRRWINGSGKYNFPDGEVFTGPIEASVNGEIRFSFPSIYKGGRVEGVYLRFKDGDVVEASARTGGDFLAAMLATDEGARRAGEIAFGLNSKVDRFTGITLLDEKIDGTMHLALGKSLPLTGGRNSSTIHWDMVADLRQGAVYADGQLCYEHGKFLAHEALPSPLAPPRIRTR